VQQVREANRGGVHYSFEALGTRPRPEQASDAAPRAVTATIIACPFWGEDRIGTATTFCAIASSRHLDGRQPFRVDMPRLLSLWRQGRLKLDHLIFRPAEARASQ